MTDDPHLTVRSKMPPQVFIGDEEPIPSRMRGAVNSRRRVEKPSGGLWTSTYTPDSTHCCAWDRWCDEQERPNGNTPWLLRPVDDAVVVEIDSKETLTALVNTYKRETEMRVRDRAQIDFSELREDGFDGVHLTADGQAACSDLFGDGPRLYGWDCESTVWLRWCFIGDAERLNTTVQQSESDGWLSSH